MMATIPEDESCSPVPHVTFVKVPEKWMLNNPQMRGRTPKPPAAAGKKKTNEEEAAAAAKEEGGDIIKKPTKTELELEAWFRKRGVAVAPQRQFVNVEALYELFRSDRGVDASAAEGDSALRLSEITLHVFRSCSGKVLNAMFPNQLTRRNGKLSITCDAIPAAPENWPPKRTNRKEMKLAKFGPKDPNRSRNVTANEGPTFMRYVNEMLKLACSPELVRLKVFPDAKELTESLAVNNAIRTHLAEEFAPGDERVTLIAVGDGNTPRTAALCAFLTKWQCVAVDPEMIPWEKWRVSRNIVEGMEWSTCATAGDSGGGDDDGGGGGSELNGWGGVRRLQAHRRKMQEMIVDCDRALLVLVHAHISLKDTLASVRTTSGECAAVILPCCNWYVKLLHPDGRTPPRVEYEDPGVVSPQRLVRVFPSLPCGVSDRRKKSEAGGGRADEGDGERGEIGQEEVCGVISPP